MMAKKSDVILRLNNPKSFVVLVDNTYKKEYSKYLSNQGAARLKFIELTNECKRLKAELATAQENVASLDSKLSETKKLLDEEKQLKKRTETEGRIFIRSGGKSCELVTNKDERHELASGCCKHLKAALDKANENIQFLGDELSAARTLANEEKQLRLKAEAERDAFANHLEEFCCMNNSENDESSSVIVQDIECEIPAENDVERITCTSLDGCTEDISYSVSLEEGSQDNIPSFPIKEEVESIQCTSENDEELYEETVNLEDFILPDSSSINNGVNLSDSKSFYSCNVCEKVYKFKRNLKKHVLVHDDNLDLITHRSCGVCCKVFKSKGNLKQHMLTHECNPDLKYLFNCDMCNRGFTRQSNLKQHMLIHDADINVKSRFKCDVCDKGFARKGDKKRHMATHNSTSMMKDLFRCTCGKKFKWKSLLKKHMLSHETGPDFGDTFKCHTCKKGFTRKFYLKLHMMTHSSDPEIMYRFKCDVCTRGFTMRSHLKVHKLNHETDPNLKYIHRCTVCGKGFKTKSHLKRHMLIHETNPELKYLFRCHVCQKGFTRKDNFKTHLLVHENDMNNFKHILELDAAEESSRELDVKLETTYTVSEVIV